MYNAVFFNKSYIHIDHFVNKKNKNYKNCIHILKINSFP